MLPNFLIIGAARCGTTTLYEYLRAHEQVFLPANKRPEPHFFFRDAEFDKGIGYYEGKYFSSVSGKKAIGEASTSYIFGEAVPARIKQYLPGARLIAMLRSPADRAYSSYWHTVASGLENLTFEEAIDAEVAGGRLLSDRSVSENRPFDYLGRSRYFEQLSRYLAHFSRDQLLVIKFEDFVRDPAALLPEVCRFIGIAAELTPPRPGLRLNASVPEDRPLPRCLRIRLNRIFKSDVLALSRLLGRDFGSWLNEFDQT